MQNELESDDKLYTDITIKKLELESHLRKVDKFIYDAESKYFENTQSCGNIIKGWDQFFSAKPKINGGLGIKKSKFSFNERVFSQSSVNNTYIREDGISVIQGLRPSHGASNNSHKMRLSQLNKNRPKKKIVSLKKKRSSKDIINGRDLIHSDMNGMHSTF